MPETEKCARDTCCTDNPGSDTGPACFNPGACGCKAVMHLQHPAAPEKSAWMDRHGDIWTEGDDGLMHTPETRPFDREHVEKKWGPLTPVAYPVYYTTPAAPETETDANGLTEAEVERWAYNDPETDSPVLFAQTSVERIVAERVRVVEGERDAEVAEVEREHEKTLAIMEAACDRADLATARAESAEAAREAEKAAHEQLRTEGAAWIADSIGYPIEVKMPDHPMPQALWEALVDHVHADADGKWHGNTLDREDTESWLADEAGR